MDRMHRRWLLERSDAQVQSNHSLGFDIDMFIHARICVMAVANNFETNDLRFQTHQAIPFYHLANKIDFVHFFKNYIRFIEIREDILITYFHAEM